MCVCVSTSAVRSRLTDLLLFYLLPVFTNFLLASPTQQTASAITLFSSFTLACHVILLATSQIN